MFSRTCGQLSARMRRQLCTEHSIRRWRESATVMVTSPARHGRFDYDLLMLKRSGKSKFMPDTHVFPGGSVSAADFHDDWARLLGSENNHYRQRAQSRAPRPDCMRMDHGTGICNDVGFRICAIRETFEESGVLICTRDSGALTRGEVAQYRRAVHDDPAQFLAMCLDRGITPDVTSLYEWACWLTPVHMDALHSNRRFETVFYITALSHTPDTQQDDKEIVSFEWLQPDKALTQYWSKGSLLFPPQVYEISRLCNFPQLESLRSFFVNRQTRGCQRWLPVKITCTDGTIAVLPGDYLYPAEPDLYGDHPAPELDVTVAECRSGPTNRTCLLGPHDITVDCSAPAAHGHINPRLQSAITSQTQ